MPLAPGEYTSAHRVADAAVPGLRRAYVTAMNRWRDSISDTEAMAMVLDPALSVLLENVGAQWAKTELRPALEETVTAGLRVSSRMLKLPNSLVKVRKVELEGDELGQMGVDAEALSALSGGRAVLDFSAPTPWAEAWAEQRSATMVTAIDESTRLAIRDLISRAVRDGAHPTETARWMRDIIGLDRRQATAYYNMLRRLTENGVRPAEISRRMESYRNRALRERALRIARTETLTATNAGVTRGWDEFANEGILDAARSVQVWIITYDSITCPICLPMDGKTLDLGGSWGLSGGFGSVQYPPAHPYCRCTVGLMSADTAFF